MQRPFFSQSPKRVGSGPARPPCSAAGGLSEEIGSAAAGSGEAGSGSTMVSASQPAKGNTLGPAATRTNFQLRETAPRTMKVRKSAYALTPPQPVRPVGIAAVRSSGRVPAARKRPSLPPNIGEGGKLSGQFRLSR